MTNQPTKWEIVERDLGDPSYTTSIIRSGRTTIAAFYGSDREANAKLFIRAQHMDELVKALKNAHVIITDWIAYAPNWAKEKHNAAGDLAEIDAAIVNIEGTP
jgi:hypothetical protein